MKSRFDAFSEFLPATLVVAEVIVLLALVLALWRLWRGPTSADRVLALDLMTGSTLALVVVHTLITGQTVYLDVGIALAVVGFVGTAALARQIQKRGPHD